MCVDVRKHAFRKMLDSRMSVTLCTDNRLVSNTSVTNEYRLAIEAFNLSHKQACRKCVSAYLILFFAVLLFLRCLSTHACRPSLGQPACGEPVAPVPAGAEPRRPGAPGDGCPKGALADPPQLLFMTACPTIILWVSFRRLDRKRFAAGRRSRALPGLTSLPQALCLHRSAGRL